MPAVHFSLFKEQRVVFKVFKTFLKREHVPWLLFLISVGYIFFCPQSGIKTWRPDGRFAPLQPEARGEAEGGGSRPMLVFPNGSVVKNLPAVQETWIQSLAQEDPLQEEMATHSSVLAWEIPWTEETGGLQSMGSQRVRHD